MTVLIYVDTSKQVGDPDHLKVVASEYARKHGCRKTIRKASCSNMRFWSKTRATAPWKVEQIERKDRRSGFASPTCGHIQAH